MNLNRRVSGTGESFDPIKRRDSVLDVELCVDLAHRSNDRPTEPVMFCHRPKAPEEEPLAKIELR